MRPPAEVHLALAQLLEYPREDFAAVTESAIRCVTEACPDTREQLTPFAEFVRSEPLAKLEELYARTFDNSEDRALEVGWHAFGENYTRGTFMVRMRQRLRELGIEEHGELPDHLSHLLVLLGRAEPRWAGDLAADTVGPAVDKIHAALVAQENPWGGVLAATQVVLGMHEHSPRAPLGAHIPSTPPAPTGAPAPTGCCDPLLVEREAMEHRATPEGQGENR